MKYIFSIFLVFVSLFLFGQCDNLQRDDEHALDGISDLILAVNYDGDWNTTNNWENLEDFEDVANMSSIDALDPKVYYSVVWTDRAWVITYGFYHPRDWSLHTGLCCDNPTIGLPWIPETGDNHENDFEGVILFVSRISTSNGIEPFEVFGAASIAHSELKTYSISNLPEVFVDNRSHAVELNLEGLDCIDYEFLLGRMGLIVLNMEVMLPHLGAGLNFRTIIRNFEIIFVCSCHLHLVLNVICLLL